MLNSPRRQRVMNYHQSFRPSRGAITSRTDSKQSINSMNSAGVEFSFNIQTHRHDQILQNLRKEDFIKTQKINSLSLNPEDNKRRQNRNNNIQAQIPLINKHFNRRKHYYIDPQLLLNPLIQDITDKQLMEKQQSQHDVNSPPSLTKISDHQKPLQKQHPTIVSKVSKQIYTQFTQNQINQNQKYFKQKVKSQMINNQRNKKLPIVNRSGSSELQDVSKLSKKNNSDLFGQTHLLFEAKRQQKKGFNQISHLFTKYNVGKLKQQINQKVQQKSKSKPKINPSDQTIIQDQEGWDQNFRTKKNQSGFAFGFKDTDFSYRQNRFNDQYQDQNERQTKVKAFSSPKFFSENDNKKLTISYKTSLIQLRQILKYIGKKQTVNIQVLVPRVLMQIYFDRNIQKMQLYNKAKDIFKSLGIPTQSLIVKRYSNCILLISKNICVIWHYDGKIYLGGWQVKYLDEGAKHGLGLQWIPNKYVYYGQFIQSKKSGLGVIKTVQQTFIGQWKRGKKTDNGHIINRNGQIFHPRISQNFQNSSLIHQNLESDPFV